MTGFSAEWLAMREAADITARSARVLEEARIHCSASDSAPFVICDLGSGTGASVAAFSNHFPKNQRWDLVDYDAANLQRAAERYAGPQAIDGIEITTHTCDLVRTPAPWKPDTDIVTATALFDLTSPQWLALFVDHLATGRLSILTTLTYDGRHILTPELPLDATMADAFNTHQKTDKGFGAAAGPDATAHLEIGLTNRGYTTKIADSSWHLDATRDAAMITALLDGWAGAVIERDIVPENQVRDWHRTRRGKTATLQVGHLDLFATPTD